MGKMTVDKVTHKQGLNSSPIHYNSNITYKGIMSYVNPTDQFRYEIETESHDLGITYVYTDDVDNAVQYCCDVSRDYQTAYSLVRDKFTGNLKVKSS